MSQEKPPSASPGPWRWDADGRHLLAPYNEKTDTYTGNSETMMLLCICDDHGWAPDEADRKLIAAAPTMAKMLRELEWSDTGERGFSNSEKPDTRCPVCHGYGYRGHTPDCRLAALLRELP